MRASFVVGIIATAAFVSSCTSDPYYGGNGYGYGHSGYYSSGPYYYRNPYYGPRGRSVVHYDVHHYDYYDHHDHHNSYNRPRPQYRGRQATSYPRISTVNRPRPSINRPSTSINAPRPSGSRQTAARPNPVNPRSYSPAPSYRKSSQGGSGSNNKNRKRR